MKRSTVARVPRAATSVLLLGMFVGISACSTTGTAGTGRRSGPRNEITAEQIADLPNAVGTAYNIIEQVKPRWLRANRSQGSLASGPAFAAVFVDTQSWGDLASLRGISIEEVERIEYLDMRDATIQYGTGYPGGIIRVVTRRGR